MLNGHLFLEPIRVGLTLCAFVDIGGWFGDVGRGFRFSIVECVAWSG